MKNSMNLSCKLIFSIEMHTFMQFLLFSCFSFDKFDQIDLIGCCLSTALCQCIKCSVGDSLAVTGACCF